MFREFLKLFYKPEEVIEKRIKGRAIGLHIFVLLLLTIVILCLPRQSNSSLGINVGLTIFSFVGTLCMVAFFILLMAAVIKIVGIMVDGRAKFIDVCIAEVYFLIPVVIYEFIYNFINESGKRTFINNLDMTLNLEIIMSVVNFISIVFFTYLFTRVIAKVQRISLKRAAINNIILIAFAFISIFGVLKTISTNLNPDLRKSGNEFNEQIKLQNETFE